MHRWTPAEIPDQSGRVAVVTGANSGLGYEVARRLTTAGAHVVLACRDQTRGGDAAERLRRAVPEASLQVVQLDLADLSSVRECVEQVRAEHPGVDLLINNAGVMALPRRQTADGFDMQFGTNHLGHFAITGRLLPALLTRPGARVVTVTSLASYAGELRFDDLHRRSGRYPKWQAYAQSKLANLIFAIELQRRLTAAGIGAERLISVAAHPGYAATHLQTAGAKMTGNHIAAAVFGVGNVMLAQSAATGALPLLYAATAPAVRGGELYGPRFLEYRGAPHRSPVARGAFDAGAALLLWTHSEDETTVRFDALAAPA